MRALVLLVLVGCGQKDVDPGPAAPVGAPTATRTGTLTPTTPTTPAPAPTAAPDPDAARWASLAARLRAHHADDLPDRAALQAIPDAAEGLRWIASHDPSLNVRARALDLLGVLGSLEAVDHLRLVLADRAAHPKLRAAAAIGLGRVEGDASAQGALLAAVADPDLRVATEAVDALARTPSLVPALRKVAAEPGVAPEIRARVDALR